MTFLPFTRISFNNVWRAELSKQFTHSLDDIQMNRSQRTFSDIYREQVIEIQVIRAPGIGELVEFVAHVKVTMPGRTVVPIVRICNWGYQSVDEARHAGAAVGRDLVNCLMSESDEVSPARMDRCR
ncbi:hypothetical protein AUC60_23550 [Pseudomonas caspiana]|uniref:Uncharacterized protein n=1 Tax=Pseudomonas caspiana TaxID=1451454 RepID=A0A1Y3NY51_9PSED|nr:hypothetical protein AUC60_23550 [Pseudomonas caspiana]